MIDLFTRNRGPVSLLIGGLGLLVLALILISRAVRRAGGWKAVLRQGRREIALTGSAVVRPFKTWQRYRTSLRRLTEALRDQATRDVARRALSAAATGPGQPYAVLVGPAAVAVLLAGRDPGAPEPPFAADDVDPRLWWADRDELPDEAGGDPLPVAMGVDGRRGRDLVVYLDLRTGPRLTAATGDPRTARALIQALAAQLDHELPEGQVQITAGVHAEFAGPDPDTALDRDPAFLVAPEPPELTDPETRILAIGGARGSARLLVGERGGLVRIAGVPIDIETSALPKAVARLISDPAPPLPPAPPPAVPPELDFLEPESVTGISMTRPSTVDTPVGGDDDFAEPEFDNAAVGRPSSQGTSA
ncbi:hypothetical protein [Dactylosporangium sp. NPDC051541]|uniref:hypothetical protein n=1 Tax=Dactylosporangium sp. NPDC051541 TaxID=3363977 RepID=UPI0037876309